MKNTNKTAGLSIKTAFKAGGLGTSNHNRLPKTSRLSVKTAFKVGGLGTNNHNRALNG